MTPSRIPDKVVPHPIRRGIPSTGAGGGELSLSRVPWEGGPDYWSQFAKADAAGWSNDTFFPIAVFLGKPEAGHPASLASLGVNTYMAVEHNLPISQVTDHLFAIPQMQHTGESGWTSAEVGSDPNVVGWFIYDECEQGEGVCWDCYSPPGPASDATRLALFQSWCAEADAKADGRFKFANFGNGVLGTFWAATTMDDFVQAVDAACVDKYAYTSGGVRFEIERSPGWPLGDTPANNSRLSSAYGWFVDRMRNVYDNPADRRPFWNFVETKMPFLGETYPSADVILYNQLEGAVWASIVKEARGVAYFQHNGFYTSGLPTNDPNTGSAHCTGTYSLIDCEIGLRNKVSSINSNINTLAPVINTQSYVFNFGATGIDTMLKGKDGFAYIFASVAIGGSTGSKTFTLTGSGITGTSVDVLFESRTLTVSGGSFTDSFANEYSHHIYKVAI